MNTRIQNYEEIFNDLKNSFSELTNYECLTLAIQIERNQILGNGLSVRRNDEYPPALEAIAISLGFQPERAITITDVLKEIRDKD